jgi:hypothetical protein
MSVYESAARNSNAARALAGAAVTTNEVLAQMGLHLGMELPLRPKEFEEMARDIDVMQDSKRRGG